MTENERAAADPGPGPGPRPSRGAGPRTGAPGGYGTPGAGADAAAGPGVTGPPHRFRRDRRHKVVAGVCAGLGRQCDMDPVIFRITLAVLSATGGLGLLFYGFAWLFVAADDEDENEVRKLLTGRVGGQALAAVLFALVGCGVLLTMLNNGGVLTFAVVLSVLLAGAGYWSQQRGAPGPDPLAAQAVADAPPEAKAPPVVITWPSWWRDPLVKDGPLTGGTGYLWGPGDTHDRDMAAAVNISLGDHAHEHAHAHDHDHDRTRARPGAPRPRPPVPRGPRGIGGFVFLLAVVAGVLGTRAPWGGQDPGAGLQTGLACALAVFGLGIAVSAFLGRTGAGSVLLAIVTAGALALSAALPEDIGTEWVRTDWTPASAAEVKPRYEVGTGVGTLDLSRLELDPDRTVTTRAEAGLGRIRVVVPPDVTVRLDVEVGLGDIRLPGDDRKDVDVAPGKQRRVVLAPAGSGKDAGTLDLDVEVGIGQVEVSRAAS